MKTAKATEHRWEKTSPPQRRSTKIAVEKLFPWGGCASVKNLFQK